MPTRRTAGVSKFLAVSAAVVILISLGVWTRALMTQSTVVSASPTTGLVPEAPKTYNSSCSVADVTDASNPYSLQKPGQFVAVRYQVLPHCIGQADDLGDLDSQRMITVQVLPSGDAFGKPSGGTATDQQMEAVRSYLSSQGIVVAPPNPRIIGFTVSGSLGAFERALHVPIHTYRFKPGAVIVGQKISDPQTVPHPETITFYAPKYDPLLPANVGKYVNMNGLEDAPVDSGVHGFQPGY